MRALEHCVQRLGRKLKVTINVNTESWANIMDHVNNAVKQMKGGRNAAASQNRQKERYAMAAGRIDHVRIVWRNDPMHPKSTYGEFHTLEVLTSAGKYLVSVKNLIK